MKNVETRQNQNTTWTTQETFEHLNELHKQTVNLPRLAKLEGEVHGHYEQPGNIWYPYIPNLSLSGDKYKKSGFRYQDQEEETAELREKVRDLGSKPGKSLTNSLNELYKAYFTEKGIPTSKIRVINPSPFKDKDDDRKPNFHLIINPASSGWSPNIAARYLPWIDFKPKFTIREGWLGVPDLSNKNKRTDEFTFDINTSQMGGEFYNVEIPALEYGTSTLDFLKIASKKSFGTDALYSFILTEDHTTIITNLLAARV